MARWFKSERETGDELDQAIEAFLAVQDGERSAAEVEQSGTLLKLGALWSDLDQAVKLNWPSDQECAADGYDGSASINAKPRSSVPLMRRFAPLAAAALLLVAVTTVFWADITLKYQESQGLYYTQTAEHRLIRLEDGSELLLGGDSSVKVAFDLHTRHVQMESGEAVFSVAKDLSRPFIVTVGETTVRAVGTAFNIRKTANEVVVSVVEGIVEVAELADGTSVESSDSNKRQLVEGEQVRRDQANGLGVVQKTVIGSVVSWRDGYFSYSGEPLSSVIDDINRYHDQPVSIADHTVAVLRYSGTINRREIDSWLNSLEQAFPVELTETADGMLQLRTKK